MGLSYKELIYKLTPIQIKEFNDTFIELSLIDSTSKNSKQDVRRHLKHKRQNAKGKLRKLYVVMLNGKHLEDGLDIFSKDIAQSKIVPSTGTKSIPIIEDCKYFPSNDYVEHSFGNELCEHPDNKNKICQKSKCPVLLLEIE